MTGISDISKVLTFLSAMLTPAVLVLASGSLVLATSQRLNRAVERARELAESLDILSGGQGESLNTRRKFLFTQLRATTRRSKLLQMAISALYVTLMFFVATSMSIGIIELLGNRHVWIPTSLGMFGVISLFYSSILLIIESRTAYNAVREEMNYFIASHKKTII